MATHIVGTSAGAYAAALLRIGFTPGDLCAVVSGARGEFGDAIRQLDPPPLMEIPARSPSLTSLRVPNLFEVRRLVALAAAGPLATMALGLLRGGTFDFEAHTKFVGSARPRGA